MNLMRVWLPYVKAGSGSDTYTQRLALGLKNAGLDVTVSGYPKFWAFHPDWLRYTTASVKADVVLANSAYAAGFIKPNRKLITVVHHCVYEPDYKKNCSIYQRFFYDFFLKRIESKGVYSADSVISCSNYTASVVSKIFPGVNVRVIPNGIDTDRFSPNGLRAARRQNGRFRMLFVGNLIRRKGADLLAPIMRALGPDFELHYTLGRVRRDPFTSETNMHVLDRLNDEALLDQYRRADVLLFPSRLEGFGYAVAESMACGTPAVATEGSSLQELIIDGTNGVLCPMNDIEAFVNAIRELADDRDRLSKMAVAARNHIVETFNYQDFVSNYVHFLEELQAAK